MPVNKVLVVDDSLAHRENLKNIVSMAGRRVILATSGKEAVSLTKAEKPDLVLMDIVMDDLDGYGACRELMADPDTRDIPVVFVSTKNSRADKMWANKQGARGLITKPFKDEDIIEALNKF